MRSVYNKRVLAHNIRKLFIDYKIISDDVYPLIPLKYISDNFQHKNILQQAYEFENNSIRSITIEKITIKDIVEGFNHVKFTFDQVEPEDYRFVYSDQTDNILRFYY